MAGFHSVMDRGKVAVVTGAASGIGLAAAKCLAGRGMRVVLADSDSSRLVEARKAVESAASGPATDIVSVTTDVGDLAAVEELERTVIERFGRVHLLMNNAGIQPGSSLFGSGGELGTGPQRQSDGYHSRNPAVRAEDDCPWRTGDDHQHRIQARHHHTAR